MSLKANQRSMAAADFTSASALAYAALDVIGVAQLLAGVGDYAGRIITLDQIVVRDAAAQNKGVRFLFFDAAPGAQVDNAAFAIGASLPNLVGKLEVHDDEFSPVDTAGVVARPVLVSMKLASANLYVVAVCNPDAGVPTYGNGGKLSCDFHFGY